MVLKRNLLTRRQASTNISQLFVNQKRMIMDEESGKETRKRTKVELTTVTEFAANVTYMCRFRPVFRPVKMWAHQQKMKDPQYGIVFKAIKLEVEPNKNSNSVYQSYLKSDMFLDDDDDNDDDVGVVKKVEKLEISEKK